MKTLILILFPFFVSAQESPTDLRAKPKPATADTVMCIMLMSNTQAAKESPVVSKFGHVIYKNGAMVRYTDEKFRSVPPQFYIWDVKILGKVK